MNESCPTYEWLMSHIWVSHATHMNESCCTYEWMSHVPRSKSRSRRSNSTPKTGQHICSQRTSHTTHTNQSCYTYEWVMPHIWMCHVAHLKESRPTWQLEESFKAIEFNTKYLVDASAANERASASLAIMQVPNLSTISSLWTPLHQKNCRIDI